MPGKSSPLVVADTNTLVSALIGKTLRPFLEYLKNDKFRLVFSERTLEELLFLLRRPKFKKYFTHKDIEKYIFCFILIRRLRNQQ